MAGLGTGPAAASPRSSPPPLPAKASRQLQVTPPYCPALLLSALGTSFRPFSCTDDGGLIQPVQQGLLDPEREVRVPSRAAVLALGARRASLPNPRVMRWMVRRKGARRAAGPVRHSAHPLCPRQLSPRSFSPSPHMLLSLLPLALVCPGRVAGLCSPGLPRDDSRRQERVGQRLSDDSLEFMPRTQSRHEGSTGAPSKLLTVVWGRVFRQSSAPGSTPVTGHGA